MSPRRRPPAVALVLVLVLVLALAAAGCGGGDFSGKATVPKGYTTYKGDRVTLAYPRGWQVSTRKDSDGGASVQITPRDRSKTPYGLILLASSPHAEKRFEQQVKGRRAVIKTVTNGKIESDEKIDVPHTKEAHRLVGTVPARGGTDPVDVKSDSLDLLRDDGDTLTVVAAAPQRKGGDQLDPKAVIDSVRLSG